MHENNNKFVVIRITSDSSKFPCEVPKLSCILNDRVEAVVLVIAHELRHLWQGKYPHAKKLAGVGKYSELDADAYALQKLNEWRNKNENKNETYC